MFRSDSVWVVFIVRVAWLAPRRCVLEGRLGCDVDVADTPLLTLLLLVLLPRLKMLPAHCLAQPTRCRTALLAMLTFIRPEFFIRNSMPQLLAKRTTKKKSKLQYRTSRVYAVSINKVFRRCRTNAVSLTTMRVKPTIENEYGQFREWP